MFILVQIRHLSGYNSYMTVLFTTLYSTHLPPEIANCNLHRTVQRSLIRNIKLYN